MTYTVIFAKLLRDIARLKRKRGAKELELSKDYGN